MSRIGFVDISGEPSIYIMEKMGDGFDVREKINFTCRGDYDISISDLPAGIDEFYLSLPSSLLNFRVVELPFKNKEKIMGVLPYELDGIIFGGIESVVLDGIILGRAGDKNTVLAVYVRKDVLKKIIERLKAFGIDPKIITSTELGVIVKDFDPRSLIEPVGMDHEAKINAIKTELKNSTIDLRKGEFRYTKDTEALKRSLRMTAILVSLAVVLFAASITLKIFSVKKEISRINYDAKNIYSEIFPEDKNASAGLYKFKSRLKELKDRESLLAGVSPLNLLLKLSGMERGGLVFSEIILDKGHVILKGESSSLGDVQRVHDALSGIFSEVSVSDSRTSAQGKTLFTITAKERQIEKPLKK